MATASMPWQDSCSNITSALKHMQKHERVVDVVFQKNKISYLYAHKLVLAIWSPKFADMIAEIDRKQMLTVTFEEDVDVVQIIVEYLYSSDDVNCFSKMPMRKLIQALEFSERHEINHVRKKCLTLLRRKKINPSNVIDYFDYGFRKNINGIVRKCIKVFETEGISVRHINENFSADALLNLLSLDKIAMNSEADLLSLAINWLSSPYNKCYRSQVLSSIDLQCISCTEYKDICKRYPHFFSDDELSGIILSGLRQDPGLLPKWYQPKIKTTVENSCSLCIYINSRMKLPKPFQILKINKRRDLQNVTQHFGFQFQNFTKVKLLSIELNYGPNEIPPAEFVLQFNVTRAVPVKEYYLNTTYGNDKYKIVLKSPLTLKSKDTLSLKFMFRSGLLANNIHVVWPMTLQQEKLNSTSEKEVHKVNMSSTKLAFYLSDDNSERYIVSSFHLNVCDDHHSFLSRKCIQSRNISSMLKMDPEFGNMFETIPFKTDVKKEKLDIKMEVDDEHQTNNNDETLKDVKPFMKMEEDITLDSFCEDASVQIVAHDKTTYINPELIDLTDEL